MSIRIKARGGEGVDQMMRRFKKLCEKEGLTKDIKRKEFYEKPSERKARAARKSVARRVREAMGPIGPKTRGPKGADKSGPGGGKGPGGGGKGPGGPGGGRSGGGPRR